ncbi:MAG: 3-hydroxyacyl-CoA dehydrogenase NAD-binding domain-containing protein [Bacteroidia bacterium]|nr:3-hydroxyacyl-CoA dehydrogenase NAD-binding domain-containing protein [Bacteroidia bacterium]
MAVLTLDMQEHPTNLLNPESLRAIGEAARQLIADPAVKGVIIASAKKDFLAGGDLRAMLGMTDRKAVFDGLLEINAVFRAMETSGKPFVACLNGNALGGGYELALACHYRIALEDPKLQIGLPEVKLGLLPGSGGTQRLPRLIGMEKALRYILQGQLFDPRQARQEGLIHEVAPTPEAMMESARQYILGGGKAVQPWDERGYKIPGGPVLSPQGVQTFSAGAALLRKETRGNYPGARYAMSCVYEGMQLPFERASTVEARYFVKALFSPEARNIIRTGFFALNKANKGAARPAGIPPFEISQAGVLGAGMMGAGIAFVTARAGIGVVLKDVSEEAAAKGKAYSEKLVAEGVRKGKVSPEKGQALLERIRPTADPQAVAGSQLVIEAVFEDRSLKARVTQESEAVLAPEAVFASNTSTLPITGLAQASARPENFIGLHFFSPVDKMPLVEVIVGKETSDYALAAAIDYVLSIKKTPIVVNDSRGFFTSRVFATFTLEGITMLTEGVPPAMIEHAARDAGMPVGPLAVSDEVSLELMDKIRKQTAADLGIADDRPAYQVIEQLIAQGRTGKKAGAGFYDYPAGGKKQLWPGLRDLYPAAAHLPDYDMLKKRLLHIMSIESVRCLDEGVLRSAEDGDLGSLLGFGFPPYTGGVFSYIEYVGIRTFVAECDAFAAQYGDRFAVPDSLRRMAAEGGRFFPQG